jgi:hypothetical protein
MAYKLICCEVLLREASQAIARTLNVICPEYTPKGAHEKPDYLRDLLQQKIDEASSSGNYEAILLGFGLCGNAASGIIARNIPIVIPRAHDCCTIFLGSREKFLEHFKDSLSNEWTSAGYLEHGGSICREADTSEMTGLNKSFADLVDQYGEDNARFIWDSLHPVSHKNEIIYIDTPETSHLGYIDQVREKAEKEGKMLKLLKGNSRLIKKLLNGEWNEDEFLIVPPGCKIDAVYDHDRIISVSQNSV